MSALDRIKDFVWPGPTPPAVRAFTPGPAVVQPVDVAFGKDPEQFSPHQYGDYLATSVAVYACVNLRAKLLASLPLKLYTKNAKGEKDEVTSGPAYELLTKVNPHWSASRLFEMTELALCLWGASFWLLERKPGRPPDEIWWARPDKMRVIPDEKDYISGFLYVPNNGAAPIHYAPDEVIWIRYPNPLDEFAGLSPLASARLSADIAAAAMKSNRTIFTNGVQIAGILGPPPNQELTRDQAEQLELALSRRAKGEDRAHRTAVLRYDARWQPTAMTPKDAEFLGALEWMQEDIARAYGVPLDLLGGQRTYANMDASQQIIWANTIKAEASFIGTEITEQLLPMFGSRTPVDLAEYDMSGVDVLKENEETRWRIDADKIIRGRSTINEIRKRDGDDPVEWGDVWWAPINVTPVETAALPERPAMEPPGPAPDTSGGADEQPGDQVEQPTDKKPQPGDGETVAKPQPGKQPKTTVGQGTTKAAGPSLIRARRDVPAYGSAAHIAREQVITRRIAPLEEEMATALVDFFRRQRAAVKARLTAERSGRDTTAAVDAPFDLAKWINVAKEAMGPKIKSAVAAGGDNGANELPHPTNFDMTAPDVLDFLEQRTQRFAREINETTWGQLKASLADGLKAGEGTDKLADRVEAVMGSRIRSSAQTIARTETISAYAGGNLFAWKQSGFVAGKSWLATLDERTRETHIEAHGQTVGIDEDFQVGDGTGPGPGLIDLPEESINCRCSLIPVLSDAMTAEGKAWQNGHNRDAPLASTAGVG